MNKLLTLCFEILYFEILYSVLTYPARKGRGFAKSVYRTLLAAKMEMGAKTKH